MAYLARYGRQPLSEILALPLSDLRAFQEALSDLVRRENGPGK